MTDKVNIEVKLEDGLQVVAMPVGPRDVHKREEPMSEEDTIAMYNDFLGQINAQGGTIIASFNKVVAMPQRGGVVGTPKEERMFLIVKK